MKVTAASLRLLRQDRVADYMRSLVPWAIVSVAPYDHTHTRIPLEVRALGNGIAYNVLVNLFRKYPAGSWFSVGDPVVPQLEAGARTLVSVDMVHKPFLGQLEVRYFDPAGRQHVAWHSVSCANGFLMTTDALNWICPPGYLVVHPRGKPRA